MWNRACNKFTLFLLNSYLFSNWGTETLFRHRGGGDNHLWYYNPVQRELLKLIFLGLNIFVMNRKICDNLRR
jgi:hypothetical protein